MRGQLQSAPDEHDEAGAGVERKGGCERQTGADDGYPARPGDAIEEDAQEDGEMSRQQQPRSEGPAAKSALRKGQVGTFGMIADVEEQHFLHRRARRRVDLIRFPEQRPTHHGSTDATGQAQRGQRRSLACGVNCRANEQGYRPIRLPPAGSPRRRGIVRRYRN